MINNGIMLYAKEIARNWKEVVRFFLTGNNFEKYKKWKNRERRRICNFTKFF
jgi:hypothetical protein